MEASAGKLDVPAELTVYPEGAIINITEVEELVQRAVHGEKVNLVFVYLTGLVSCLLQSDADLTAGVLTGLTITQELGPFSRLRVKCPGCRATLSDFNCPPGTDSMSYIFKNYWLAYGHFVRLQKCRST